MKKNIFILLLAVVLVIMAVYSVQSYKLIADRAAEKSISDPASDPAPNKPEENSEQTERQPESQAEGQAEGRQEQARFNLMDDYDFNLEDLKGNKVTLSQYKGKKVFLNFWATWCPPCKTEMPDMEKLYQETKDTDLIMLAVNVGEDKNTVQSFISKNEYNFAVLLDTKGEVSQLYQVKGIPTSYFIDTEGFLDDGTSGAIPLESMRKYVNKLK